VRGGVGCPLSVDQWGGTRWVHSASTASKRTKAGMRTLARRPRAAAETDLPGSTIASTRSAPPPARPQQHAARTPATSRAAPCPLPHASGGVLRRVQRRRCSAQYQMRSVVGDSSAAPTTQSPGMCWRCRCHLAPAQADQQQGVKSCVGCCCGEGRFRKACWHGGPCMPRVSRNPNPPRTSWGR